jgi:hypothetical protein
MTGLDTIIYTCIVFMVLIFAIRPMFRAVVWAVDKYEGFAMHVWPVIRLPAIACMVVFALFFVLAGGTKGVVANAHRLSCHVNETVFGPDAWGNYVNCEARFYNGLD